MMKEEEFLKKRVAELAKTAYHRDIVTFTDFLTLNELHMINSMNLKALGVTSASFGGYESAERQLVAFHPDALSFDMGNSRKDAAGSGLLPYPWEFPIACIKIEQKSAKFAEKLSHRDYLGALLNLGVERSTIGDILTEENCAWFFCLERMTGFFLENLTRVKHSFVYPQLVEEPENFPKPKLESITGTCSSVRLDALIAIAFNQSRSSMTSLIESGNVFVNGKMITSNGYTLKEKDLVSVRGKGRFLFDGVVNQTKKGRYSVLLYRYV